MPVTGAQHKCMSWFTNDMKIQDQANNMSLRRIVPNVQIMWWMVLYGDGSIRRHGIIVPGNEDEISDGTSMRAQPAALHMVAAGMLLTSVHMAIQ